MKVLTEENCPHCKKSFESSHELENLEPKITKGKIKELESTAAQQTVQEVKEPEIKEVVKAVSPSDEPYFACKNGSCGELHDNPNYTKLPDKKCKNCDTLNGIKKCKNCKNSDPEEFEEIEKEDLTGLGIPEPKEHEHSHED